MEHLRELLDDQGGHVGWRRKGLPGGSEHRQKLLGVFPVHVRHEAFWLAEKGPSISNVVTTERDVEHDCRPEWRLARETK